MTESSIQIEQAFYGNAKSNYQLLACSASQYSAVVTNYCEAIGTPDGIATVSPFLFSIPYRNVVMMFCCQSGEPDSNMRQTLFFHALIAERDKAELFNVNAFSLWKAGYFTAKPQNPCKAFTLSTPLPLDNTGTKAFPWNGESLAIVSNKEENQLIHGLLGKQVNTIPWAGFSFQTLKDFKIYVISQYVNRPLDRICVTTSGEAIAVPQKSTSDPYPTKPTIPQKNSSFNKVLVLLLSISLLANVLLLAFASPWSKSVGNKEDKGMRELQARLANSEAKIMELQNNLKNSTTKEKVIEELRAQFPEGMRIPNFNSTVQGSIKLQLLKTQPVTSDKDKQTTEPGLFSQIETYINFVNKHILTSKTIGEEK